MSAFTSGRSMAGFRMSPSSPPVQHTSTVRTPSAWYLATVPAPLDDSSSGWACTARRQRGSVAIRRGYRGSPGFPSADGPWSVGCRHGGPARPRGGQPVLHRGRAHPRPRPGAPRGPDHAVPGDHGPGPVAPRRRRPDRRPRVSRAAQRGPGPVQGRHPLPPHRRPQRGTGAGVADDLEDRVARPSLRRRQGRHRDRSHRHEPGRAAAADAPLHQRHPPRARHLPRHPRARRQHQRPDDGVDDGRLLGHPRVQPGDRDRQAPRPRRRTRPRSRDRAGLHLRARRVVRAPRASARRPAGRDPGVRQRRVVDGSRAARTGRQGGRRVRRARRDRRSRRRRRARRSSTS